jgi:hypothetical protein
MPLAIRLPTTPAAGTPLIDWLATDRHGRSRPKRAVERLVVFIQQWDHLRDELAESQGREPVIRDYHGRWGTPIPTVYRMLEEFREVFGPDADPTELSELLWQGMPRDRGRSQWLLAVKVEDI